MHSTADPPALGGGPLPDATFREGNVVRLRDDRGAVPASARAPGRERPVLLLSLGADAASVRSALAAAHWRPSEADSIAGAQRALQRQPLQVGVVVAGDLGADGYAALDAVLKRHSDVYWVGAFAPETVRLPACRDLILDHLFDHHTLPVDARHLALTLGHAHGHAMLHASAAGGDDDGAEGADGDAGDGRIIGRSAPVRELMRQLRRVAKVDAPVLVCGESGSGKELAAQAIHRLSRRADGPFVAVNCGAIQPTLIQAALFGHVKGAFTGATRDERGLIEAAAGGTIFLDEIGDLSLDLQINLLRFLQEHTITPVGSTRSVAVDVRVVAATHVELERAVADGAFRGDLFYRLNVLPVTVPPLRERRGDIALLAQHVFETYLADRAPQLRGFSQRALRAMTDHDWRGNVRELVNRVRRAVVMAEGRLISPADLGLETATAERPLEGLSGARTEAERSAVEATLHDCGGNVTEAARRLGVSRMTLYRLIAKHAIGH